MGSFMDFVKMVFSSLDDFELFNFNAAIQESVTEKDHDVLTGILPRSDTEFALVVPAARNTGTSENHKQVLRTHSVDVILERLDSIINTATIWEKPSTTVPKAARPLGTPSDTQKPDYLDRTSEAIHESSNIKHSRKYQIANTMAPASSGGYCPPDVVWWLDVTNPTWDDMRAFSEHFPLHPLTIEDILHQEEREKLESFPKLGYYFISFKAPQKISEGVVVRTKDDNASDYSAYATAPMGGGYIDAINVYVVVFRQGICSFHSHKFSDHFDNVFRRTLRLEDAVNVSSDWIAHGILDSIVDAFFPILAGIEKEINEIEALSIGSSHSQMTLSDKGSSARKVVDDNDAISIEQTSTPPEKHCQENLYYRKKSKAIMSHEKYTVPSTEARSTGWRSKLLKHILPKPRPGRRQASKRISKNPSLSSLSNVNELLLLRIAHARRVVTSLGRHLASKGEVMTQLRKRLLATEPDDMLAGFPYRKGYSEIAIYMGDIHDHIVTLQQSLSHYERVLNHLYPASLSQIRLSMAQAKGGTDKAILTLSVISLVVLCIQVLLGLFSINIGKIPANQRVLGAPFNVFGIIVALSIIITITVLALVRYWWYSAKNKYSRHM